MRHELDKIDRHILGILKTTGRIPMKGLSSAVGLSRSALLTRIKRLEETGVILGYKAIVSDDENAKAIEAVLLVKVQKTPAYDVIAAIKSTEFVRSCRSVTGDVDLIVEIAASSVDELNETRDLVASVQGVLDVKTHIVLATNFKSD
ncbi:MAG: Lrp/AsnC family transcriptional regulator [Rhizobiaceae bacterium]